MINKQNAYDMKKCLFILFLFFTLGLSKVMAQDSLKVIIIGFVKNWKYQISIDNVYIYEFDNPKYEEAGCFIAEFPERFFNSSKDFYIHVRCKRKFSLRWKYCEVPVEYDPSKKYFLLFKDYSTKTECFRVSFSNEYYSKGFRCLYEEGSEKIYGPNKIKLW